MTEREKDALFGRIFMTPVGKEFCRALGSDGVVTVAEIVTRVTRERNRVGWGAIYTNWPWEE